jgi:hypothetical protein
MYRRFNVEINGQRSEVILPAAVPRTEDGGVAGCPKCKGTTFYMEGCFRRAFTCSVHDSVEAKETMGADTFRDIDTIYCPVCQIRFIISDETSYQLYRTNQELLTTLASLQGLAGMPTGEGRPN